MLCRDSDWLRLLGQRLAPTIQGVLRLLGVFLLIVLPIEQACGETFREGAMSDFSNDAASPTELFFLDATNRVSGVVGGQDLIDYWSFQVRPGQSLDSISLSSIFTEEPGGRNDAIFLYLDTGPSTTVPSNENASSWLGGFHLTDRIAPPFENILNLPPVTGGSAIGGLGAGFYTVGVQQNGPYASSYSLEFQVSGVAVPEPSSVCLLLGAAAIGATRRRRPASKKVCELIAAHPDTFSGYGLAGRALVE